MKVGVLGIQGDVSEHLHMTRRALDRLKISGSVHTVRKKEDLDLDALILPGGESTMISSYMREAQLFKIIKEKVENNLIKVMGTCAGAIILADKIVDQSLEPLHIIPMTVKRNAFGRQVSSFEFLLTVKTLTSPFNAVFIRAPKIVSTSDNVDILAKFNDTIVFVSFNGNYALSFHPELTNDSRIHEIFISALKN